MASGTTLDRLRQMRKEVDAPSSLLDGWVSRRSANTRSIAGDERDPGDRGVSGADGSNGHRGRNASDPREVPAKGWKDILVRSWNAISENNLFLVAGGVTYVVLLALFPGLAALVSLYGLAFDPADIERQIDALSGVLPDQAREMLAAQLHQLVTASSEALGIGAIIGLLFALWSASRGMSGLITALNIAYGQNESRGFIHFNLLALVLTIGAIISGIVAIGLVAVLPAVTEILGLQGPAKWVLGIVKWPLLFVLMMAGLAVLYRHAPNRDEPQWRWVSPGAIAATMLWILGSIGFTIYVANFSSYDETYGALGGVVVLLTWLYLSAFCVLAGATINAQSERQTRTDTTKGVPRPMGARGAYAADTLGRATDGPKR